MQQPLALIVDDEPDIRKLLEITLARMDIGCLAAENLSSAYALLEQHRFDICLVDMRLPDGDGLELIAYINNHNPQLPTAVITAHGNMETAIQALRSGAFDFLTKPVDLGVLRTLIRNALKLKKQTTDIVDESLTHDLLGETAVMKTTRKTIAKLARSQVSVHISGESGTGKELVAKIIHQQGARASAPFVAVNCGAIPTELMESELFGHVKGSFTGAIADKDGLFRAAEGGTLFFDEIAELPLHMQVKLLRAIQEKSVRPVGSNTELSVDVRLLSASHQDLSVLVQQGKFRQDLFYRINVIEINIPPLRERLADLPLLVAHQIKRLCQDQYLKDRADTSLSAEAIDALNGYHFPGNIRELENILQRAMTFCEGKIINVDDLQLPVGHTDATDLSEAALPSLDSYLHRLERQALLESLEKTRWNKTAAAKLLGISLRALRYRLEKLGLDK